MDAKRFSGKKVLVTGAGTGIGREIALAFGREGADVVLHYLDEQGALSAAAEIQNLGPRAHSISADFRQIDEVFRLSDAAVNFLGGMDILVNNAGITLNKPVLKITPEQFDILYAVNVRAQLFLTQRAVDQMANRGRGAIVNMSSVHGFQGAPEHAVYAGTKGAVIAQTRALGVELAHKGIRINAVAPGWIAVESHSRAFEGRTVQSAMHDAANKVPVGRAGFPEDIARMVLFLCSEEAAFIIGQTIVVDGGTTALMSLVSDFRTESTARCGIGYVPGV